MTDYYWIGGDSGGPSDTQISANWSLSSGGTPLTSGGPDDGDVVIFDSGMSTACQIATRFPDSSGVLADFRCLSTQDQLVEFTNTNTNVVTNKLTLQSTGFFRATATSKIEFRGGGTSGVFIFFDSASFATNPDGFWGTTKGNVTLDFGSTDANTAVQLENGVYPNLTFVGNSNSTTTFSPTAVTAAGTNTYPTTDILNFTTDSDTSVIPATKNQADLSKVFRIHGNITAACADFNWGNTTLEIQPQDTNGSKVPYNGVYSASGNFQYGTTAKVFKAKYNHLRIAANSGKYFKMDEGAILSCNKLTILPDARFYGPDTTVNMGAEIQCVELPTILGDWNFSQIAEGIYRTRSNPPPYQEYHSILANNLGSNGQVLAIASDGSLEWSSTAGGGGVTVQDEGSTVGTTADILNFEGNGVVATGSGATKTITITDTDTNTNQLTEFTLAGDSGSSQTIAHGNTLTIAGGTNITSVASATDTITLNVDDAFLKNDADDATTGTITAAGFAAGTSGVTTTNGPADFQRSHASNPTMTVEQDGTGDIAVFKGASDELLTVRRPGSLFWNLSTAGGATDENIMTYRDSDGDERNFMSVDDGTIVLHNRGPDGDVEIRANTSTAGSSGEVSVAQFQDSIIDLKVPTTLTSTTSDQFKIKYDNDDKFAIHVGTDRTKFRYADTGGTLKDVLTFKENGTSTPRVGVHQNDPDTAFHVGGDIKSTSAGSPTLYVGTTGTSGQQANLTLHGARNAENTIGQITFSNIDDTDDPDVTYDAAKIIAFNDGGLNAGGLYFQTVPSGSSTTLATALTIQEDTNIVTAGNLTVGGNLIVSGDSITVNAETITTEEAMLSLGIGQTATDADALDFGFYGTYDVSDTQKYRGLFADASDSGKFKLFKDLEAEPTTTVNTAGTGYAVGTLVANLEGDVTGNVSGTAATVTDAAQSNITSVGTLTSLAISGDLTVDTSTLKVDSTNNRVGIGTSNPATRLHIERSESDAENLMLRLRDSTVDTAGERIGIEGYWNTVPAGDIEFELLNVSNGASAIVFSPHSSGGTKNEAMRIVSDGNVGIGTTSPTSRLHVNGGANAAFPLILERPTTGGDNFGVGMEFVMGDADSATAGHIYGRIITCMDGASGNENGSEDGYLRFDTSLNGTVAERMRILSSGNVGIGTTSPAYPLDVSGTIKTDSKLFVADSFLRDDGSNLKVVGESQTQYQVQGQYGAHIFYTQDGSGSAPGNYTEVFKVNYLGNIELGSNRDTTIAMNDTAHDTAGKALTISAGDTTAGTTDDIAGGDLIFEGGIGKGTGAGGAISFKVANAGSTGSTLNTLATAMTIADDGNVGIGTTSPNTSLHVSDAAEVSLSVDSSHATGAQISLDSTGTGGDEWRIVSGADNAGIGGGAFGLYNVDTTSYRFNVTSAGNVGIGTTSPAYLLDVAGAGRFTGNLRVENTLPQLILIDTDATDDPTVRIMNNAGALSLRADSENVGTGGRIEFTTSGTERMRLTDAGNLGIGTTSPDVLLDIEGTGKLLQLNSGNDSGTYMGFGNTRAMVGYAGGGLFLQGGFDKHLIFAVNNGTFGSGEVARFDKATGSLGIGTTAPSTDLHVAQPGDTSDHYTALTLDNGIDTDGGRGVGMNFRVRFGSSNIHTSQIHFDFYGDKWTDSIGMNYVSGRSGSFSHHHFRDEGGTTQMMIADNGNVGIGSGFTHAAQPGSTLDVVAAGTTGHGLKVYRNQSSSNMDSALVYLHDDSQYADEAVLHVKQDGTGVGVLVEGSLQATTKSFDIEHPTKEGKRLHHGSLEGPEHGVYIRGKNNSGTIHLPDYWKGLVDEDTITVQLTAIGKPQELYVREIKNNRVRVAAKSRGTHLNYFYFIQAERKDVEKMVVEY